MKNITMRSFQHKGRLSVDESKCEPTLLTGRAGPLFFLIPADRENLKNQYNELMRATAQTNLTKKSSKK